MNKLAIFGFVLGSTLGITTAGAVYAITNSNERYDTLKILTLDQYVGSQYFKESEYEDRLEGMYKGFVYGVEEENTMYLTEEETAKKEAEANGSYVGTGIYFTWGITNQYLVVTDVIENSPAQKEGIEIGDRILAIDDILAMMSNEVEIYDKLSYSGDEKVKYTIQKKGSNKIFDVNLKSVVVDTPSFKSTIIEGIGVVEIINLIDETDVDALLDEFQSLNNQGINKYIIDLRNVSNAELDGVVGMTDIFLGEQILFKAIDKNENVTEFVGNPDNIDGQVALLTNSRTSGVIEAMVGSLRENNRVIIIGEETAGNAYVQEIKKLEDGSSVLVSTKMLQLPNSLNLLDEPIIPDQIVDLGMDYTLDVVKNGVADIELDTQLQTAIGYLNPY
ncbi:hypothetical protein AN639_03645 [Candidatus Epulonipiscium fishelsonii]|uniref:Uncharacterized protein n=1 Tax=Candidatus Epulonipiscium fishelsonii TaxID=77094 RepID=A0ACC8XDC7_9FIRM|nr:hypothetical protein AN396_00720 [Epulopiscium sp. SCG-B11WGA-EpuloA1]ONI41512.1 hypothetical protein AN639_03645 [Epulopiscium sp. SCG-B05WGA-EpuloA1]